MRSFSRLLLLAMLAALLSGCGYNAIQQKDEQVKAGWAEVLNQYKRRADLVPNLVQTVEGYANQERQVLTEKAKEEGRPEAMIDKIVSGQIAKSRRDAMKVRTPTSLLGVRGTRFIVNVPE